MTNFWGFVYGTLLSAMPVIIAGIGALISQKAGVLNVATEGLILAGAFAAAATGLATGSSLLALLAGAMAGLLVVQLHSIFSIRMRANIFIVGLGINLLMEGGIPLISRSLLSSSGVIRLDAGFSGSLLDTITALFLTLFFLAFSIFLLNHSRWGLEITAAGSQRELLQRRGVSPERRQIGALCISGITAGIAGALLILRIGAYAPGMSAGRGWIALAAVFLGFQRPLGVAAGALLFGLTDAIAGSLQIFPNLPSGLLMTLPYIIT
ncbi:MAG: ABC transporter permease, partial [Spirochaetaceae bacterium]